MATIPKQGGTLDIVVTKGATYSLPITDNNTVPIDFTAKTWVCEVRPTGGSAYVFVGTINVIDATHLTIDFTATQTASLAVTNTMVNYEMSIYYTVGSAVTPFSLGAVIVQEL